MFLNRKVLTTVVIAFSLLISVACRNRRSSLAANDGPGMISWLEDQKSVVLILDQLAKAKQADQSFSLDRYERQLKALSVNRGEDAKAIKELASAQKLVSENQAYQIYLNGYNAYMSAYTEFTRRFVEQLNLKAQARRSIGRSTVMLRDIQRQFGICDSYFKASYKDQIRRSLDEKLYYSLEWTDIPKAIAARRQTYEGQVCSDYFFLKTAKTGDLPTIGSMVSAQRFNDQPEFFSLGFYVKQEDGQNYNLVGPKDFPGIATQVERYSSSDAVPSLSKRLADQIKSNLGYPEIAYSESGLDREITHRAIPLSYYQFYKAATDPSFDLGVFIKDKPSSNLTKLVSANKNNLADAQYQKAALNTESYLFDHYQKKLAASGTLPSGSRDTSTNLVSFKYPSSVVNDKTSGGYTFVSKIESTLQDVDACTDKLTSAPDQNLGTESITDISSVEAGTTPTVQADPQNPFTWVADLSFYDPNRPERAKAAQMCYKKAGMQAEQLKLNNALVTEVLELVNMAMEVPPQGIELPAGMTK